MESELIGCAVNMVNGQNCVKPEHRHMKIIL